MFQKRLVVLMGAGASIGSGYPLGPELVRQICETNPKNGRSPFARLNLITEFENLREAIRSLDHSSIDRVLQTRRDLWSVGKLAITQSLLKCESHDLSYHTEKWTDGDHRRHRWYGGFFELLTAEIPNFAHFAMLPLTFVTFNYDRSFDFFSWRWLNEKWPDNRIDIDQYLLKNPIIHLHGQFGKLEFQVPEELREACVDYASYPNLTPERLQHISTGFISFTTIKLAIRKILNRPEPQSKTLGRS
jgi:hypothetical protein